MEENLWWYVSSMLGMAALVAVTVAVAVRLRNKCGRLEEVCDLNEENLGKSLRKVEELRKSVKEGEETIKRNVELISRYEKLCSGYGSVHMAVVHEPSWSPVFGRVAIVVMPDDGTSPQFILKKFCYRRGEPGERNYAMREANELKETIEKWSLV